MRKISIICLFLLAAGIASAQSTNIYRGSIPEVLLRPGKGEAAHYPIDTVIGEMGQGSASDAAFSFANWVAAGLLSGRMNHPALENINPVIREGYLSYLGNINPMNYRIGGGREEPDGSTSFLVRFIGKDLAILAEMYVRHVMIREVVSSTSTEGVPSAEDAVPVEVADTENVNIEEDASSIAEAETDTEETAAENVPVIVQAEETVIMHGSWTLEDLLLDEPMDREQEERTSAYRIDSVPYERFF